MCVSTVNSSTGCSQTTAIIVLPANYLISEWKRTASFAHSFHFKHHKTVFFLLFERKRRPNFSKPMLFPFSTSYVNKWPKERKMLTFSFIFLDTIRDMTSTPCQCTLVRKKPTFFQHFFNIFSTFFETNRLEMECNAHTHTEFRVTFSTNRFLSSTNQKMKWRVFGKTKMETFLPSEKRHGKRTKGKRGEKGDC